MPPVATRTRRSRTPSATASDASSTTAVGDPYPITKPHPKPKPKVASKPRPKAKPVKHERSSTPPDSILPDIDDEQPPTPVRRLDFSTTTHRKPKAKPTSEMPSFIVFSPLRAESPRPPPRVLVTPPTPSPTSSEGYGYDPCQPSRGFSPERVLGPVLELDAAPPHAAAASAAAALEAERSAHAATRADLDNAHTQLEEQDGVLVRLHAELADLRAQAAAWEAQRAAIEARALADEARMRAQAAGDHDLRVERESLYAAFNDLREAVDAPEQPPDNCLVQ